MTTDYLHAGQPDILEVIANLSSDAVFTPPSIVNAVLDLLPESVWSDPALRWLDPGSKTGVFPREIVKRLMVGLEEALPNPEARLSHILSDMIFAVATESITAMMSRRTLYCSRDASSGLSAIQLKDPDGHVWHKRIEHAFGDDGRCLECKGSRAQLEQPGRDNRAYAFIHEDGRAKVSEAFGMQFDVIVGNPPYQMTVEGSSDIPIYQHFVDQAVALNPRYISLVIPARWFAGGKGLDDFRSRMLTDRRLSHLVDYVKAQDVFPTMNSDFEGGVCFFLWDREHDGPCSMVSVDGVERRGPVERNLDEYDVFVRDARALPILRKVLGDGEAASVEGLTTGQTPFGFYTNFKDHQAKEPPEGVKLLLSRQGRREERWVRRSQITKGLGLVDAWKVLVPKAYGERGAIPAMVLGPSLVAGPRTCCTQTYLAFGPFGSKDEAESFESYLRTRFARFLILLRKVTQDAGKSTYRFLPIQAWDQAWTDESLYKKYKITREEQTYIESMIREMPS